ncbi:hypothetical protein ABZ907_46935 [Nonomuraea wenchangensis]
MIAALNSSLTAHDQLILTSRRKEFTTAVHEAGRPLTAAAIIVPKPITSQAAADYLTACLPGIPSEAWTRTLTALHSRAARGLAQVAATPLGLWLIRAVYLTPGADPTPLTGPLGDDADALRAHLLDRLIPALIEARPPSTDPADHFRPRHRLDLDATRRYLTYLARVFHPATTRDIAWWRIARTIRHIRSLTGLEAGLVFGVAGGLVFGVAGGLVFGLVFGLLFRLESRSWVDETPGYASFRGRPRPPFRTLKRDLMIGLVVGFAFGGVGGLALEVGLGLVGGLTGGLVVGLVVGPVFALIDWTEQPTLTSTSSPCSTWRSDRTLTLLRTSVLGLVFALTGGLVLRLVFGLALGFGLMCGLALGLVFGLLIGNHRAWPACIIAISWLALTRRLPWRLMNFLDDAHRLGLLRAVGPVYQFRHAALHDHLATTPASSKWVFSPVWSGFRFRAMWGCSRR